MIVDSSAIIAILKPEPEGKSFRECILNATGKVAISAANYLECAVVIDGMRDQALSEQLDVLLHDFGVVVAPVTEEHARIARQAYVKFGKGSGHPAQLNFGDCFSYALAKESETPLLFKGNDFSHTDLESARC